LQNASTVWKFSLSMSSSDRIELLTDPGTWDPMDDMGLHGPH